MEFVRALCKLAEASSTTAIATRAIDEMPHPLFGTPIRVIPRQDHKPRNLLSSNAKTLNSSCWLSAFVQLCCV